MNKWSKKCILIFYTINNKSGAAYVFSYKFLKFTNTSYLVIQCDVLLMYHHEFDYKLYK